MALKTIVLSVFLMVLMPVHGEARVPDVVSKQRDTVVTVSVDERSGGHIDTASGFIVDQQGVIVTGCGIIAKWLTSGSSTLSVTIEGNGTFPVEEVISPKCENALALIRINADGLPTVKVARGINPRPGEDIFLITHRSGSEASFSEGRIRAFKEHGKSYQISLRLSERDSGSPLFNLKGEVVGVGLVQPRRGTHIVSAVSPVGIFKQLARYRKTRVLLEQREVQPGTDRYRAVKPDDLQDHFSRGCSFDQTKMYREAIEAYREALRINPDFVEAYINLGVDYYRIGRYDDAITVFKQIIGKKPDLLAAYQKLGAAHIMNSEYSEAIVTFKKAIEIEPGNASSHFNLGLAYFLNGDIVSAHEECTRLRNMDQEKANNLSDLIY